MEILHNAKLCELFAIETYIEFFKVTSIRQTNARLNLSNQEVANLKPTPFHALRYPSILMRDPELLP